MTRLEHLLTILLEECAEVSKEVTKSLRFGLDDHEPGKKTTNREKLLDEVNDLFAMIEMLQNEKVLGNLSYQKRVDKRNKVEKFLGYSHDVGTLMGDLPRFMYRPNDFSIFQRVDEANFVMQDNIERQWVGNKYPHDVLVIHGFIPCSEEDFEGLKEKHDLHYEFLSWQSRSDGHGGSKGGTFEEFLKKTGR